MKRFRLAFLGLGLVIAVKARSEQKVLGPEENQDQTLKKRIETFEPKSRRLLAAIEKGRFEDIQELFFPELPFIQLKAIARPRDYYLQLVDWYRKDFDREVKRFQGQGPLQFQSLSMGFCKWKDVHTEANAIAYWSCYKSKIRIKVQDRDEVIEIRTLINWGPEWYITHFGPIPKS